MLVSVSMQLRNHADAQPAKRFKRQTGYAVYIRYQIWNVTSAREWDFTAKTNGLVVRLRTLEQGLQTFLSEGHISCRTTIRGLDILRNVIVSGYITFYQINKCFVNILFFHYWQNVFAGRVKWLRVPD